jgi:hypothetical protein
MNARSRLAIACLLVSFDLYFLAREAGQSWEDVMDGLEEDAEDDSPLDPGALARWERVKLALTPVLPDADEFVSEASRELTDDATGIQVSIYGRELTLTAPCWYEGPGAQRLVGILRVAAAAIEEASGLTAYDPQADAPFLGEGEHSATSMFELGRNSVRRTVQQDSATGTDVEVAQPSDSTTGLWRRLFGRDSD